MSRAQLTRINIEKAQQMKLALMMSVSSAFLLCGYELARSSANTLFKFAYGKESLPYAMAIMPLGVILATLVYGKLLSRFGPKKTLNITTLGSGGLLALCFFIFQLGWTPIVWFLFILREVYMVLLIEQYWSYIDCAVEKDVARKINGPVIGISSLGAIAGGLLLGQIVTDWGTEWMILFAALSVLPASWIHQKTYAKFGEPQINESYFVERRKDSLGLSYFKKEKYLIFILAIVVVTQVVSASLDLNLQGALQDHFPVADEQTAFSGQFFALVNSVAFLFQFLLAPLLLKFVSPYVGFLLIPIVHIGACAVMFFSGHLYAICGAFLLFKSLDYSLFRITKEILYLPLSLDIKYRSKEIVDVIGYRFGKGLTSVGLSLLKPTVAMSSTLLTGLATVFVVVWLGLALRLKKYLPSNKEVEA